MRFVKFFAALPLGLTAALLACASPLNSRFNILDPAYRFACSPDPTQSCKAVLPVRGPEQTQVALLLDKEHDQSGEISLAARLQTLQAARHSIRIQALVFTGDESGLKVAEILKNKKARHPEMDIRVIVDAMSNPGLQTQWMYYDLKQNKIEVEGYESLYLEMLNEFSPTDPLVINKRFHDKMWVIDGEDQGGVAIVGGLNVANEYFRVDLTPKNHWRDQDVILRGTAVQDVARAFDENYAYFKQVKAAKPGLFNTDKTWALWQKLIDHTIKTPVLFSTHKKIMAEVSRAMTRNLNLDWQPAKVRFIQSRPRYDESYVLQSYLDMIHASAHPGGEILIANAYFIPEPEISDALLLAAEAGAHIVVLTNSLETNDLPQLMYASRYLYLDLIDAGVEIHEYAGKEFGEGTLHAKFAVFDRVGAIVGSYNLDARSQKLNSETVLAFESEALARNLADQFLNHDLPKSRSIGRQEAALWHGTRGLEGLKVQMSLGLKPML